MMPDRKKQAIYAVVVVAALAVGAVTLSRNRNDARDFYGLILEHYETISETRLSELEEVLVETVNARVDCYGELSYDKKLLECRKQYMRTVLEIARQNIKSSPSLGEFMLCVRDCPLTHALCRGTDWNWASDPSECIETEARCLEWCLDAYWRGGQHE